MYRYPKIQKSHESQNYYYIHNQRFIGDFVIKGTAVARLARVLIYLWQKFLFATFKITRTNKRRHHEKSIHLHELYVLLKKISFPAIFLICSYLINRKTKLTKLTKRAGLKLESPSTK